MVIKELFEHPELGQPVAIIDEDPLKTGLRIHGVHNGNDEGTAPRREKGNIKEIVVAIPSAPEKKSSPSILNQCKQTGCKLRRCCQGCLRYG